MMGDAFDSVLVPILRDLRDYLHDIVVIGGWVPELHRRFGDTGEWAVKPLRTTEVDILIGPAAALARQARNQVGLVVNEKATTALRQRLAQSLSVRHGITHEEGDARARGFLTDFLGLTPADCRGRST